MRQSQRLLIIDIHPFGRLTDLEMWVKYLKGDYEITLLTLRQKDSRTAPEGVRHKTVFYDNSLIGKTWGRLGFVLAALWNTLIFKGKIFVVHYETCGWLKRIMPWKKMHIDVRTLSVSPDPKRRATQDLRIISDCRRYDSVSIISRGLIDKMRIPDAYYLPLGSEVISDVKKDYGNEIRLLYVGTLRGRRIPLTIQGVALFMQKHPDVRVHYDIIGQGSTRDNQEIVETIEKLNLQSNVTYHGYVAHDKLTPFFDQANVGCVFVPMTEFYEHQPPTKIFEYALSGIYSIATATAANRELVTPVNGCVIEDTADGFAEGLGIFLSERAFLDESKIRDSLAGYTWENIVETYLKPILAK